MVPHQLLILLTLLFTSSNALIDCSLKDSCFGEPPSCDPNTECDSLLHFDPHGNLHMFLRNFTDPVGYAAFAVDRKPREAIEYFMCLPHQGQRLRAVALLGGSAVVTEQARLGVVQKISRNYFRCVFNNVADLRSKFQKQQILISKGTFNGNLDFQEGMNVLSVDSKKDFEEEEVIPIIHQIRARLDPLEEDVYGVDESELISNAIDNLPKGSISEDEKELARYLSKKTRSRPDRYEEEDSRRSSSRDEDEQDQEEDQEEEKEKKTSRKHPSRKEEDEQEEEKKEKKKPNSKKRPSRDEEDSEDEKKSKKKSMRDESDEEEKKPKGKKDSPKPKKKEDPEDSEEDEDEEDDEENSGSIGWTTKSILAIAIAHLIL